jgi:hypothetical protein
MQKIHSRTPSPGSRAATIKNAIRAQLDEIVFNTRIVQLLKPELSSTA